MEYSGKPKDRTLNINNAFRSIDEMWWYNFDMYKRTHDLNWFIDGYDGRQKRLSDELLKPIEEKITEEYYKLTDDRSFQLMIQRYAKINQLQTKYLFVSGIIQSMSNGFGSSKAEQEIRAQLIESLRLWGFKMNVIASPLEDAKRLLEIHNSIQGITTQIRIIENEIKREGAKETMSFQKQLLIIQLGLQLPFQIDPKKTTVAQGIEMIKLLEEKSKKN